MPGRARRTGICCSSTLVQGFSSCRQPAQDRILFSEANLAKLRPARFESFAANHRVSEFPSEDKSFSAVADLASSRPVLKGLLHISGVSWLDPSRTVGSGSTWIGSWRLKASCRMVSPLSPALCGHRRELRLARQIGQRLDAPPWRLSAREPSHVRASVQPIPACVITAISRARVAAQASFQNDIEFPVALTGGRAFRADRVCGALAARMAAGQAALGALWRCGSGPRLRGRARRSRRSSGQRHAPGLLLSSMGQPARDPEADWRTAGCSWKGCLGSGRG